jgi:hypothetical protein
MSTAGAPVYANQNIGALDTVAGEGPANAFECGFGRIRTKRELLAQNSMSGRDVLWHLTRA